MERGARGQRSEISRSAEQAAWSREQRPGRISDCGFRIWRTATSMAAGQPRAVRSAERRSSDFRTSREQRGTSREQRSKVLTPDLRPLTSDLWGPPDVNIRFGRVDRLSSGIAAEGSYFRSSPEETQLFWEDVGTIQVRGGREITIDSQPGVEEALLRLVVLGPVLGVLLQQRGHLVLHASAVAIADGAVVFLGDKGWGKSTIAAALYSRGYGIVADDVAAVDVGTGCPIVQAGFPQLKLWPDTAFSLGDALETLPRLHSQSDKRACRVDRGFPQTALSLRAIYVLAQGTTPKLEPLPFGKAFLELVRHSYRPELLGASGASSHFLQCASITKSTRIRYLRIPRSLSILPDVARLVEEDIACHKSEQSDSNPSP